MGTLDWAVVVGYFFVMVAIGLWSRGRVQNIADFFTAGGKMPWWLSGISHHMSGYSAVMFVAFASEAYRLGLTVYVWWSLTIGIGVGIGAFLFAPRWNRLRAKHNVASPLEYLAKRYNLPTQQVMAYAGALLKVVDIAAKWAAVAILLRGFAGVPITWGIIIIGLVTMVYSVLGGLWADALTDFGQFIIQAAAGFAMFFAVAGRLGWDFPATIWDKLPESHSDPLAGPYTSTFLMALFLIKTLEYNGGMWNLAQRYMAAPSGFAAKRSALLSSALWLVWPLVLFFPMWAAPLIVPGLQGAQAESAYIEMGKQMLPAGMIGLVLAGFFSHTMAMVSSDANVIAAVINRDMLPHVWKKVKTFSADNQLLLARVTTFTFIGISMIIAIASGGQGFVLKVVVDLVAATMGPIAIPLMLGLLPWFRKIGSTAAIASVVGGLGMWAFLYIEQMNKAAWVTKGVLVSWPLLLSLVLYLAIGFLKKEPSAERDILLDSLNSDADSDEPEKVKA